MRIQFERTGGLAAPAMRRGCTVDTASLPKDEAREVEDLLDAANLFAIPAGPAAQAAGRDVFTYRITVEDGGRRHSVEVPERGMPAALRPLIDWLKKRATPGPPPS